jgi:uncharacterized repeat protein (TIGR02543 family)
MIKARKTSLILAIGLLLGVASQASAVTVTFRQASGTGYVSVPWDGVSIHLPDDAPYDGIDHPDWTTYRLRGSGSPATRGEFYVLMGIKGLLTELPISSSDITTATLTIYGDYGDWDTCILFRATTDWLADPAGQNESDTSAQYADVDSLTSWAAGAFSINDYDESVYRTYTWPECGTHNHETPFDVTDMIKSMYDEAKPYGFCLTNYDSSDENIIPKNPATDYAETTGRLTIEYTKVGNFTLTVNSGSGDGSYSVGEEVVISADAVPSGYLYAGWTGDGSWTYEPSETDTVLAMPPRNATVTATYSPIRILTVNSGTGSGQYIEGQVVPIEADPAPTGYVFAQWIGDTDYVTITMSATTDLTMPSANVEVTATYTNHYSSLSINSGLGSGYYAVDAVVAITADPPPTDYWFDQWWGEGTFCVDDVDSASTTITMPDTDVEVTATYSTGTRIKFRHYYPTGWPNPDPEGTDGPPESPESGYTAADFDDVYVHGVDNACDHNHDMHSSDPPTVRKGLLTSMADKDFSRSALIATKDLFSLLPPTSGGGVLWVHKAELRVHYFIYPNGDDLYGDETYYRIARITTDWLPDAAGSNEMDVTGQHSERSRDTHWASGDISFDDWDIGTNMEIPISSNPDTSGQPWYNGFRVPMNATGPLRGIYLTGTNYGVCFLAEYPTGDNSSYQHGKIYHDSEDQDMAWRPTLVIDYEYVPGVTLTVNSGSGSGAYLEGAVAEIVADASPTGKWFDEWIGDTDYVADVNVASTTVTMPASATEVTATYTVLGDRNRDGFVGQTDLDIAVDDWGRSGGEIGDPRADVNGDAFVGHLDLDWVLYDWGKGTPP